MTSEEALNKIHSALDASNVCDTEQLRTEFDTIRKDLEVLETIKRELKASKKEITEFLDKSKPDFDPIKSAEQSLYETYYRGEGELAVIIPLLCMLGNAECRKEFHFERAKEK